MKIIKIFILLLLLILGGCNGATDKNLCYENVRRTFPNAAIYASFTSESMYTFIVIKDSSVYLVKTMNQSNPNVSSVIMFEKKQ